MIGAGGQVVGDIDAESEISTSIEPCFLSIDEDCCFVVHCAKVEEDTLARPARRYGVRGRVPAVQHPRALHTCEDEIIYSAYFDSGDGLPDRPLSKQDGTSTELSNVWLNGGLFTSFLLEALRCVHTPLRVCHWDRWSRGLGYCGHGLVPTSYVQGVVNGGVFTEYPVVLLWRGR